MYSGTGATDTGYGRVLALVVESAMIYSVALVVEITLYFMGSNAFYIIYDPIAQLTSIIPTMILLLVGLKLTSNDIHSRMTKTGSAILSLPSFRPGTVGTTTADFSTPVELESAELGKNEGSVKIIARN